MYQNKLILFIDTLDALYRDFLELHRDIHNSFTSIIHFVKLWVYFDCSNATPRSTNIFTFFSQWRMWTFLILDFYLLDYCSEQKQQSKTTTNKEKTQPTLAKIPKCAQKFVWNLTIFVNPNFLRKHVNLIQNRRKKFAVLCGNLLGSIL